MKYVDVIATWDFRIAVPDSWSEEKAAGALDWEVLEDGSLIIRPAGKAKIEEQHREQINPPEIETLAVDDE